MAERLGLLVMHHGTPDRTEDIGAFYTRIRRGRPPTDEQLADLVRRYEAIGGLSPLTERTRSQVEGIQAALGDGWLVIAGAKHVSPTVEDAVAAVAAAGITTAVAIVLAPHYSVLSVGEYIDRAGAAASASGLELRPVESWHLEPELIAQIGRAHV